MIILLSTKKSSVLVIVINKSVVRGMGIPNYSNCIILERTISMNIYKLYVKTHKITGLKYLGQTTEIDHFKYTGSGVYWKNHLKVHGFEHDTEIIKECQTKDEIRFWGEHYSNLWNVVESNDWANLKSESGEGGAYFGHQMTVETRALQAEKAKQRLKQSCPHCGITCSISHFKRWHGDNCKLVASPEKLIDRISPLRLQKITCQHCGKTVMPCRYKELHGDNCSQNPVNINTRITEHVKRMEERAVYSCIYCPSSTKNKTNYLRWHGPNCKHKP